MQRFGLAKVWHSDEHTLAHVAHSRQFSGSFGPLDVHRDCFRKYPVEAVTSGWLRLPLALSTHSRPAPGYMLDNTSRIVARTVQQRRFTLAEPGQTQEI